MNLKSKEITSYFRSAVAAQANMGIDFKEDKFYIFSSEELLSGKLNLDVCHTIFEEAVKSPFDDEEPFNPKTLRVIICAKTIKTIFDANEKTRDEFEELTGVFYIPAILTNEGALSYDDNDKKLPWFPREYLEPMVEAKLAIGKADAVDAFMSNHVDRVEKIKSWTDYVTFFKGFYESVSGSEFKERSIRNLDPKESLFELENNMYLFIDKTVHSTFHIIRLYNELLKDESPKILYDNFISTHITSTCPLIENDLPGMKIHCGQMGGAYPLSPSQREVINHFNYMSDGEVLAVNGPPGTGKTTLLQSIVADMYVKRAIKQEKAPLIVASSTNNQAVTNIISSFGNIKKNGLFNLEERWIEGVNGFATYFPSGLKVKEARNKGYQYTNQKGNFFVADIEDKENIEKSKVKLQKNCNEYFKSQFEDIKACQNRLHEELLFVEKCKNALLSLAHEVAGYDLHGETIIQYLNIIQDKIEETQTAISNIRQRVSDWENCYQRIPWFYKLCKFIKRFSIKIQTEFRLFITEDEQNFLNEYMRFDEIKEKYSRRYTENNTILSGLKDEKDSIAKIKNQYDNLLEQMQQHKIIFHESGNEKYELKVDYINNLCDKKLRYLEFWLAVHYYECRWVSGEDVLSEKQKGRNFANVLNKFYNRLSMITPCLVMTFYMAPRQFLAYGDQKSFFLYNYIDLLIVDEAGQVSPEIAAGFFSLAKKAVVVGDVNQIEPVWSINRALDKALAFSNRAIQDLGEFELLEQTGLNCSCSSVMKVAAKSCKFEKFDERGLFLSEHRRCYDEIIEYCNKLVYKGNLQPMRGKGKHDGKLAIKQWPQMGLKQIDTDYSNRRGSSRFNRFEAEQIIEWLKDNFDFIVQAYPGEVKENLVGIITPFKAQVNCIQMVLKRQMPNDYYNISVGTVHTFQGAERRIIILSTVYGSQEGCFFIDSNKSLMNVAVSRAKDYLFVFGDINCLKGTSSSASGLLKKCISSNALSSNSN